MSPVGHSIFGLTLAALAVPWLPKLTNDRLTNRRTSRFFLLAVPVVFVALASLPDWPIPNWGHDRYRISHSLFVNLALIFLVAVIWWLIKPLHRTVSLRIFAFGIMAWLSHLLLDTLYAHGRGLAMFWPFSETRVSMPIPWFQVLNTNVPMWHTRNLSVFGYEALVYTPILIAVLSVRFILRTRREKSSLSESRNPTGH